MRTPKVENIAITGGAGFIGTNLSQKLTRLGYRIFSIDLKGTSDFPVPGVQYFKGDVRNERFVTKFFKEHDITTVFHLAAVVSVPLCQEEIVESYAHNVGGTLSVLQACKNQIVPVRFVFASSAALYGTIGNHGLPLIESDIAKRFNSFYAAEKHASEKMIELYTEFHHVPTFIFRFFNVYGFGQNPDSPYSGVITLFLKMAREGKPLTLFGGGGQTRDFISVEDISTALSQILKIHRSKWKSEVLNLGSGKATSILELSQMINGTDSSARVHHSEKREGDVLHSLADISKVRKWFRFQPSRDLKFNLKVLSKNLQVSQLSVNIPKPLKPAHTRKVVHDVFLKPHTHAHHLRGIIQDSH